MKVTIIGGGGLVGSMTAFALQCGGVAGSRRSESTTTTTPSTAARNARLLSVAASKSPFSRFTMCASPQGSAAMNRMVSAPAIA